MSYARVIICNYCQAYAEIPEEIGLASYTILAATGYRDDPRISGAIKGHHICPNCVEELDGGME